MIKLYEDYENDKFEPLKIYLKEIIGDDYMNIVDSTMYMGSFDGELEGETIKYHQYKNGMTRKSILLGDSGIPYNIADYTYKNGSINKTILKEDNYMNSFSKAFGEIKGYVEALFPDTNPYAVTYEEYKKVRDEKIKEMGYNITTKKANDL